MELRVKEVIKAKGLTMQQVADVLGITRDTLTRNINGNPTIDTLQKIANVIGCKVGDFFADELDNAIRCPNCGAKLELKQKED